MVVPLTATSGRQVVQDVAEAPRRLALDLDGEQVALPQARTTGPSAGELAGRSELRVVGQLVDDRVADVLARRVVAAARSVAEERLADDLVRQRLAELVGLDRRRRRSRRRRARGP